MARLGSRLRGDPLIYELNSGPMVASLEKLTGIEHLRPDAQLVGGAAYRLTQVAHRFESLAGRNPW